MGIGDRLFDKQNPLDKESPQYMNLAFVLLSEASFPHAEDIVRAYKTFAPPEDTILTENNTTKDHKYDQVLSFQLSTHETALVAIIPAPVPNGEADENAGFSVSSFGTGWKLPPHKAHLIVTFRGNDTSSYLTQLSRFTSLLAAVVQSAPSVGIYWGNAGATHDSKFFLSVAANLGVVPRVMIWTGISVARENDGRLSLLSLGMQQLKLPDLLLICGKSSAGDALGTMFDLLGFIAERGEAFPEGDTVGRTADERLVVRYVQSPIDSNKKVWRVELP